MGVPSKPEKEPDKKRASSSRSNNTQEAPRHQEDQRTRTEPSVPRPTYHTTTTTTTSGSRNSNNTGNHHSPSASDSGGPAQREYSQPDLPFDHTVRLLPGGLRIDHTTTPINGPNPATTPLPQFIHRTPGYEVPRNLPYWLPAPGTTSGTMAPNLAPDYPAINAATGQSFQPQVPDTTYGPYLHTWRPRFDNQPGANPVPAIWNGSHFVPLGNTTPGMQQPGMQPPMMMQSMPGSMMPPQVMPYPNMTPMMQPQAGYYQPQMGTTTAPIAMPMMPQGQGMQAVNMAPGMMPPMAYPAQVATGAGAPMPYSYPGNGAPAPAPGPGGFGPPDVMGIGKTGAEYQFELARDIACNQALEPQDMKPADDDPSRMYLCQELDGNWTQRNRFSLDRLEDMRWYVWPNGVFYAKRLPN